MTGVMGEVMGVRIEVEAKERWKAGLTELKKMDEEEGAQMKRLIKVLPDII